MFYILKLTLATLLSDLKKLLIHHLVAQANPFQTAHDYQFLCYCQGNCQFNVFHDVCVYIYIYELWLSSSHPFNHQTVKPFKLSTVKQKTTETSRTLYPFNALNPVRFMEQWINHSPHFRTCHCTALAINFLFPTPPPPSPKPPPNTKKMKLILTPSPPPPPGPLSRARMSSGHPGVGVLKASLPLPGRPPRATSATAGLGAIRDGRGLGNRESLGKRIPPPKKNGNECGVWGYDFAGYSAG